MATPKSGGPETPTAIRVRQVRRMQGYGGNAVGFAKFLGVTQSRLSNIENGLPLSIEVAQLIVQRIPGISLDWLYYGRLDAVPLAVQQRLEAAVEDGKATRTPSSSKGR